MTQVSQIKLRPEIEERIYKLLVEVLAGIRNTSDFTNFLDDFISPTEKTVLAKRLAIAVLIAKGNDYDRIRQVLRVTPSTIAKMSFHMQYGNGSIRKTIDKIAISDSSKALLQELLSIFDLPTKGLPISEYHKKNKKRNIKIQSLKYEL